MRLLPSLALLFFATSAVVADPPKKWSAGPLTEARERLLKGNYEEARTCFAEVAKQEPKLAPQAAVGIAQTHREVGDYDTAKSVLDDALKNAADHPDLLAARADLEYELGKWDAAATDAAAAIKGKENQLLARWTQARVLRETGDLDAADKAIRWIVRHYTARSNADDDIVDPDELAVVAAAGAENARWHNASKQFAFILNEVIGDALKADPNFWPAEVLAGQMLLEKYNKPDAGDAFDKALQINPKAADAMAGKGQLALQKFELTDAEKLADRALKVNPKHAAALRLKADVLAVGESYAAAEKLLLAAKAVNPRDPQTLGRLAAVYRLQRRPEFEGIVKEAEASDTKPGIFYATLAHALEDRKRFADAETFYRKAGGFRPMVAMPQTGLGMLQIRLGFDKEGRDILTKAFDADPFNVRVSNTLKVLKHLDKYETVSTPHYELRFDPTTDKVLGAFIEEYLEEVHADLKKQYGYEPPGRTRADVFSTHEMFSGRIVGVPDLHTVGACTGKIFAMASPTAKGLSRPFNWARVLRHELTHVFNLAQSDFVCPHWLTEGLAVRNEKMTRPLSWYKGLRDRADAGTLLDLDTVMLGFVRPRSPDEWQLAYCQSNIYVEYLVKAYGEGAIQKLLEAYRGGADTATAIKTACGVDKATFEAGYRKYVEELLKPFRTGGKPPAPEKAMTFDELVTAQKNDPADADLNARLAEQQMLRSKPAEARKLANAALEKAPGHPVATVVKARLLQRAGDDESAKEILAAALKANPDEPRLLLTAARFHIEAKEYAEAAALLERGRKVAPLDGDWRESLVKLYTETKDTEKLVAVLKEIVAEDPDELSGRIILSKAALDAGRFAEAEKYALDAIRIDVNKKEARENLLAALRAQKKDAEADKLAKRFGE